MDRDKLKRLEETPCQVAVSGRYVVQNGKIISKDLKYVTVPAGVLARALCNRFGVDLEEAADGKK